jgi:hypothetical protein
MSRTLEETLLSVWQQAMVENLAAIVIDGRTWPVKQTARRQLRQIDFQFDGKDIRGLEQNPDTRSRWVQMARAGKKVMQFLGDAGYLAVVVDGQVHFYGNRREHRQQSPS